MNEWETVEDVAKRQKQVESDLVESEKEAVIDLLKRSKFTCEEESHNAE